MRVFISYASKDGKEYATKLCNILSNRGHDPYIFNHGCVSETIWDEIARATDQPNNACISGVGDCRVDFKSKALVKGKLKTIKRVTRIKMALRNLFFIN